jgi:hypothetical protein
VTQASDGVQVETLAGSDVAGGGDGQGTAATFDNPVGVALGPNGDLFVTEYEGRRVRRVAPDKTVSLVFAGLGDPFGIIAVGDVLYVQTDRNQADEKTGTSGTIWRLQNGNALVVATGLGRPRGIVPVANGKLFLADFDRHVVSILDPATGAVTPLAGTSGRTGLVDALGDSARFNQPYGSALLPDGSVVVADYGNNVIRRVTLDGDVSTFAGDGVAGMRDDTDKLHARFYGPQDVAVDQVGNVFVSDTNNARIRRITNQGAVETIAGDGRRGYLDGAGAQARFFGQEQIEVSADGKALYVSDGNRGELTQPYNRVRRVTLP